MSRVSLCLWGLLMVTPCCLGAVADCGPVTIWAVDSNGRLFDHIAVTEFVGVQEPGKDFSGSFIGSVSKSIPCAEYRVRVNANGRYIRERIDLWTPSTIFVLAASGQAIFDNTVIDQTISGRLVGARDYERMWVKVVKASSSDFAGTIAPVSAEGLFRVPTDEPLEFVFIVNGDTGVLFLGRAKVTATPARVTIDLKSGSISVSYPGVVEPTARPH